MAKEVPIKGFYSNEDLFKGWQLRTPDPNNIPVDGVYTEANTIPYDLTGKVIEAKVFDPRTESVKLTTTTTENTELKVFDAEEGKFGFDMDDTQAKDFKEKKLKYRLVLISGTKRKRLWGGDFLVTGEP